MRNKILIFFISLLIGFTIMLQINNDAKFFTFANVHTVSKISNQLGSSKEDIKDLKKLIEAKRNKLYEYKETIKNDEDIIKLLKKEISNTKVKAGFTDLRGEGILIRMNDNPEDTGNNINFDIVHDVDLSVIVNDLINAGAEGISINGRRVVSTSEIVCVGPLINVNGEGIAAPFVIKAIGNKEMLAASINAPNTYGYKIKNYFGIEVTTLESEYILIPKYTDDIKINVAKPISEEGE
ncbi:MAG: DUF881 domain-containing protein [Bacillota bacterium]|nr:DUF881 domain-containing protein [Bacillota bacterium]